MNESWLGSQWISVEWLPHLNCTLNKRSESGERNVEEIFRFVFLEQDAQKADTFQVTFTVRPGLSLEPSVENKPRCCYLFPCKVKNTEQCFLSSAFSGMCRLKDRFFDFNISIFFPTIAQAIWQKQWQWLSGGHAGFVGSFGSIPRSSKGSVKQCQTWNSLGRVVRDGDCTCCSLRCVIRFWKVADELV